MNYTEFLEAKKHSSQDYGIDCNYIPEKMFDFQKYVLDYTVKKGRAAVFLDTGLGKTIIELATAKNYIHATNKPVLIITPLAVAFQFLREAEKFGIDDIMYSKDGKYNTKIVVCNYERLDKFDHNDFECVILDESSILKNFDGAIRNHITTFLKRVKYRYLFTATPSPNDFVELGTSSEALGYMGYTDMLTKFFTNNEDTISPQNIGTKWILKGHAKNDFFKWVSSWSISMRKPSDLGFSDDRFILPDLKLNYHPVKNDKNMVVEGQIMLFNNIARRLTEVREEQRLTIDKRCELAAELIDNKKISMAWCNLNDEADILEKLIFNSINVQGSDSLEKKEDVVKWFLGEKCLCNTKQFPIFELNRQITELCGNQNTQKIDVKNIKRLKQKDSEEKIKVELLMKTKYICQSITKIIQKNSNYQKSKKNTKTILEDSVMQRMQSIEKNVSKMQKDQNLQKKDLRELLNSMVYLLQNIKNYTILSQENAQYVDQWCLMMENKINFILTIAIIQEMSEDCYAQIATLESDTLKIISNYLKKQSCICGHESGRRVLISKSKIFGFGLNFQHCNHTVFFPTFSYEQYYQAIRRFWRFGQTKDVNVDLVYSDGQKRVLDSLLAKTEKADQLFTKLNSTLHSVYENKINGFDQQIIKPNFV